MSEREENKIGEGIKEYHHLLADDEIDRMEYKILEILNLDPFTGNFEFNDLRDFCNRVRYHIVKNKYL